MEHTRCVGDYEIDPRLFQLRRAGEVIPVERRVFDLIAYLVENSDRVVSSDELLRVLWSGRKVSKGSLSVAVAAARKALRDDSTQAQVIITHRGRGYHMDLDRQPAARSRGCQGIGASSFVGRDRELATLRRVFEEAGSGRSRLVSVFGEPGIGKSRLVDEFASSCRGSDAVVAFGRCRAEQDGAPSFGPWVQIAGRLCRAGIANGLEEVLVDEAPEIAALLAGPALVVEPPPIVVASANARFRLFSGFARFLRRAGGDRTLIVILDDVHRADLSSLMLLDFALGELREARLLVVATYRPFELESDRARLDVVAGVSRCTPGIALELEGLGSGEIARLIRFATGCTPTPEQTRAVGDLTNGNPFFVAHLLPFLSRTRGRDSHVVGMLPRAVRDAIGRQTEGLSAEAADVLVGAAVIGREFDDWLVERALGRSSERVGAALREAAKGRIVAQIEAGTGRWRFSHALVRDVLYQGLEEPRRARLHAAIAEGLDRARSVRRERLPEIAHHFAEAVSVCGADRAIASACEAARAASEDRAYEAAAAYYAQAQRLAERFWVDGFDRHCGILSKMGAEQVRAGDRDAARQSFEKAARIADSIAAWSLLAEAAMGVAPGLFAVETGVLDDALVALLRRALESMDAGECEERAMILARLGAALFWCEDGGGCSELGRSAAALAGDGGDPSIRLRVVLARWLAEWSPYQVEERRKLAAEAVDLARAIGSKEALAISLLHRCVGELESGEVGAFDRSAEEFRSLASDLRQPQPLWYAELLEAARALHSGRFVRAREKMERFFEIGRGIGDGNAFLGKMAQSLVHSAERGTGAEMVEISEAASRRDPVFIVWRASRCWGLALSGEGRAAARELEELLGLVGGRVHRRLDWPTSLALMSEAAMLLGRADAAGAIRELLMPLQGRTLVLGFCVMTWGPVSRYLGMLSEVMALPEEAEAWYQYAVDESARSEGEPWLARSEAALARVWKRLGRPSRATEAMRRRALQRAARLGMSRLHREIAACQG